MIYFVGRSARRNDTGYDIAVFAGCRGHRGIPIGVRRWHTLLFFTLPRLVWRNSGWIVFLQPPDFSLAFRYLIYVLHSNRCPTWLLAALCAYIWINPFMSTYMMNPWKDIGQTIFAIILMAYYVQIVCSKGEWLCKKKNLIVFSVVAVVCA